MSLTIDSLNMNKVNFFSNSNGLVSGTELEAVTKEILQLAPSSEASSTSQLTQNFQNQNLLNLNNFKGVENNIKVFGVESKIDAQTVKMIATNQAGFDVQFSDRAISALDALRVQAAKAMAIDVSKRMEGKINVTPDNNIFALNTKNSFFTGDVSRLFESSNLGKDRKGPAPFFIPAAQKDNKEEKEGLDLVI